MILRRNANDNPQVSGEPQDTGDPRDTGEPPKVTGEPLLRAVDLTRHFRLGGMLAKKQVLHAVDDLDLTIGEHEIVALVGESGSGKSTVARLLARVYPPTRGEIYYRGRPIHKLRSRRALFWYRGEVSMVFQDPFSAFNPVFRVSHGVLRNLALHRPSLTRLERRQEAGRVFESVGLSADMLDRFPYEMSGGERQRVGFAQALAVRPRLILADEPVSMLDVSILYITHDIASARYVADRILVLYAGRLAEAGPTETVLRDPKHPYTQLLLSAVADDRDEDEAISADTGEPPRVINPTEGCRFRWRCPYAIDKCSQVTPQPSPIGSTQVAGHVAVAAAAQQELSKPPESRRALSA